MQQKYNSAFIFSVILHIVILCVLIFSFEFTSQMPVVENSDKNMKVISAVVMDNPLPSLDSLPAPTIEDKIENFAPPTTVAKEVVNIPDPAIQKAKLEAEQKAIAIKQQQKKKIAEEKKRIAKQLLDDLKKEALAQKKLKQKMLEAAFAKELKEQSAKSLQKQLRQEQNRITGAKVQGEVNKFKALILQAISQKWIVPVGADKKLSSELLIRLAPGGTVLDVQITKSSGNIALDRSARDAVFKASPLPVPSDSSAFDEFRQFVLRVKPENVVVDNG